MAPRPYRMDKRRAAGERTRRRIISAAHRQLASRRSSAKFSIDEIARRAGVARMTVYYQFGTKRGLMEALFDDMAQRGLVDKLIPAFEEADPDVALAKLIDAFCAFWASDRTALRRVRALSVLDPELEDAIEARDRRRYTGVRSILARRTDLDHLDEADLTELVDVIATLTSFETYDTLATGERSTQEIAGLVTKLVRASMEDARAGGQMLRRTAG